MPQGLVEDLLNRRVEIASRRRAAASWVEEIYYHFYHWLSNTELLYFRKTKSSCSGTTTTKLWATFEWELFNESSIVGILLRKNRLTISSPAFQQLKSVCLVYGSQFLTAGMSTGKWSEHLKTFERFNFITLVSKCSKRVKVFFFFSRIFSLARPKREAASFATGNE